MSKLIRGLLDAKEPQFSMAINDLEKASGNLGIDVRLTADIATRSRIKMRELGLDPTDTTPAELYQALIGMVQKHDIFLAKHLGISTADDVETILLHIKSAVEHLKIPKTAWVIKCSVAKRLLKAMPPKHLMSQLGYRSIDSMLKREDMCEIYGALRFAESDAWMRQFVEQYKLLEPGDFESRKIEVMQLDPGKWGALANEYVEKHHHNVTHLKEMGVILLLPLPVKRLEGLTITLLPTLIHYINEIRLYSSFFKMQQVKANFGEIISHTVAHDPAHHVNMAGQPVHWRVIHRYFGSFSSTEHPELFEPHVQPEDLEWRKAEDVLYRLEPALHFWNDLDYVGIELAGQTVSFNVMDLAISYVNRLPFERRVLHHLRGSLWNELYGRYVGHKALEHQVLKQLDSEMLEPELFAMSVRSKA